MSENERQTLQGADGDVPAVDHLHGPPALAEVVPRRLLPTAHDVVGGLASGVVAAPADLAVVHGLPGTIPNLVGVLVDAGEATDLGRAILHALRVVGVGPQVRELRPRGAGAGEADGRERRLELPARDDQLLGGGAVQRAGVVAAPAHVRHDVAGGGVAGGGQHLLARGHAHVGLAGVPVVAVVVRLALGGAAAGGQGEGGEADDQGRVDLHDSLLCVSVSCTQADARE